MNKELLSSTLSFFLRPISLFKTYKFSNLRPDIIAGLTVAIVLLPQAIAYALIAELPAQVGLYAAIIAAIVGALWGSSQHLHTGPTNAISLLVLSILFPIAEVGTEKFILAAGLMAVMVGILQIVLGLARLGVLINFISDSVVIGFTAGAGVLISANQLRHLLGLDFPSSHGLITTLQEIFAHISDTHMYSLLLGIGVIFLIIFIKRLKPRWPGPLIGLVTASAVVGLFQLDQQGISVLGQLPRNFPPIAKLPLFDIELIGQLSSGALAVAAIGLIEAMAIARAISSQSGQRLDSNQEFVGQGLANIFSGFFSGYATSGSFTRSSVNSNAGARTQMASLFSGIFTLTAMLIFAPLAIYVPRTALAGVLLVTAYGMIDREEIVRIWLGTRGDAYIMLITFGATIFLPLQFAVLVGILISFVIYINRTSVPKVVPVLPAGNFKHFTHQPENPSCPQLLITDLLGDLYFGAVHHVEEAIHKFLSDNKNQRYILLRLFSVDQCDISGIHVLESIVQNLRDRGGDVFMMRTQEQVLDMMKSTGFYEYLGSDHFLTYDEAISHLFHKVLDPAICIYECDVRVFYECQNLPKRMIYPHGLPLYTQTPHEAVKSVQPQDLWDLLHENNPPLIIDVREPREYSRGHIPQAECFPLFKLLAKDTVISQDRPIVFVCRSGRRSLRVSAMFTHQGFKNVRILHGGMLAWETAGLLEAID